MKWHYPAGLLYDLYAGADPASKGADISNDFLPWRLTVHFSDWPDEELVRLDPDGLVMNDAFINSVKEADFLRNGTAKGIMSLSKEDSSGLWKAVEEGKLSNPSHIPTNTDKRRPPNLPTNNQHPPNTPNPTLPPHPHPNLPPPPPRLRRPLSKSSPIAPPPFNPNLQPLREPIPRHAWKPGYPAADCRHSAALAASESVSQSENPGACEAGFAWRGAAHGGPRRGRR